MKIKFKMKIKKSELKQVMQMMKDVATIEKLANHRSNNRNNRKDK